MLGGGVDFCRPLDLFRVLLLGIHEACAMQVKSGDGLVYPHRRITVPDK